MSVFPNGAVPTGSPVATAKTVEILLSPFAAIRGDAVFKSVRIVEPELQVEQGQAGLYLPKAPGGGRIASAIDAARQVLRDTPDQTDATRLPTDRFGSVSISGGRIRVAGDASATALVANITGTLDWPSLDRRGRITLKGMWRGEETSVDIQSNNPLLMLAGGQSTMAATLESPSGAASFTGTARFGDEPYIDGKATFTTRSFSGLAKWAGARLPDGSEIGAASLSSTISGDAKQMKFDGANIEVNGNRGTGAIELTFEANTPEHLGIACLRDARCRIAAGGLCAVDGFARRFGIGGATPEAGQHRSAPVGRPRQGWIGRT